MSAILLRKQLAEGEDYEQPKKLVELIVRQDDDNSIHAEIKTETDIENPIHWKNSSIVVLNEHTMNEIVEAWAGRNHKAAVIPMKKDQPCE